MRNSRRVKQGHTKFQAILYKPGSLAGYDNEYVACVHACFITKVEGSQVYFTSDNGYPYICHEKAWNKKHSTRRKALRDVLRQLDEVMKTWK